MTWLLRPWTSTTSSLLAVSVVFVAGILRALTLVEAGTSGGVAAGRLAAADPSLKILLIESGPHVKDDFNFVQPGKCLSHLRPDNPIWKVHVSNVSEYLGGRPQIVTCPHVVGGGSSVNCECSRRFGFDYLTSGLPLQLRCTTELSHRILTTGSKSTRTRDGERMISCLC